MRDEQQFTPHAEPGWLSWDEYSPEQDFCRFVGMLQRVLGPAVVLETGVGVGRITDHLDLEACEFLGFESNPMWRREFAVPAAATPEPEQMAVADLVILDSDPAFRFAEFETWVEHGKPGSVCVVHDCGNGHGDETFHAELRRAIEVAGVTGAFFRNPRGGWLGVHG